MDKIVLEVYVDAGCLACRRAEALAGEVAAAHPEVTVRVVRGAADGGTHHELVAAVPTYVLNGQVVSLGNPLRSDLDAAIARARREATWR